MPRVLSLCALLFCLSFAQAAKTEDVHLTVNWIMPDGEAPWQEGMGGETIEVILSVATKNGQENTSVYVTVDYESADATLELDVTGLPEGFRWAISAKIPEQTICGNNGSCAIISAPLALEFTTDDDFPESQSLNFGLLTIAPT